MAGHTFGVNFVLEAQRALQRGEPELADYYLKVDAGLIGFDTFPPYPPGERPPNFGAPSLTTTQPLAPAPSPVAPAPTGEAPGQPSDTFLDVLEELLGGLNQQPTIPSTPINVGGGADQAFLNLEAFKAAQAAEVARQQVATNLLGFLQEVQQSPFSIVPALQAFSAVGGGTNALGKAFAATGGQGITSPYGPAVDALIQSLLGFSLTPPSTIDPFPVPTPTAPAVPITPPTAPVTVPFPQADPTRFPPSGAPPAIKPGDPGFPIVTPETQPSTEQKLADLAKLVTITTPSGQTQSTQPGVTPEMLKLAEMRFLQGGLGNVLGSIKVPASHTPGHTKTVNVTSLKGLPYTRTARALLRTMGV